MCTNKEAVPEGLHHVTLRVMRPNSTIDHRAELDYTTPISVLKAEVDADVNPAGLAKQTWIYNDKELEDGKMLGESRVLPESVIKVYLKN